MGKHRDPTPAEGSKPVGNTNPVARGRGPMGQKIPKEVMDKIEKKEGK